LWGILVKKIVLAALLAATAASAQAAVTFSFSGAEFGGAAVSGTLTIDTDVLATANRATAPALDYYFATGDAASSSALPFLSISFTSAGSNPALLLAGDYSYQWLQADPADGSLGLELDWQVINPDSSVTSSTFTLSGFALVATAPRGGVLLPDFAQAGAVYFTAQSGTGDHETYDVVSSGAINFTAPVPEAPTWSMLVLGFGAVGVAARRRVRVTVAA
jgi:hypothetical protein